MKVGCDIYLFLGVLHNILSIGFCLFIYEKESAREKGINKQCKIYMRGTWALFPCLPLSYKNIYK